MNKNHEKNKLEIYVCFKMNFSFKKCPRSIPDRGQLKTKFILKLNYYSLCLSEGLHLAQITLLLLPLRLPIYTINELSNLNLNLLFNQLF